MVDLAFFVVILMAFILMCFCLNTLHGGPGILCNHPHGVHSLLFLFVDGGPGVLCGHPHGVHYRLWRCGSGYSVPELQLRLETGQGRPQEALLPDVRGTLPRGNRRCVHRNRVHLHSDADASD